VQEIETKRAKIRLDLEKQAAQTQDNQLVKTLGDGVAAAYQSGSETEIAERIQQGYEEIAQEEDPARRNALAAAYQREISFNQTRQNAADTAAILKFEDLADTKGLPPSQRLAEARRLPGLSKAGKEKYLQALEDGSRNRETAENRAALAELRALIDENGEAVDVEAFGYERSLTNSQIKSALRYQEKGGQAGVLTQTAINLAYQSLKPNSKKKASADLYDHVLSQLKPGEYPTHERLKDIISNFYVEGEASSKDAWGLGYGQDMNYLKALKEGWGDDWLPDVTKAEAAIIKELLQEKHPDEEITEEDIRWYKKHAPPTAEQPFLMGIPLPKAKRAAPKPPPRPR